MDTLFGYDGVTTEMKRFLTNPSHIYLLGPSGSGKTSLIKNFLYTYFAHHYGDDAAKMMATDVFMMNSNQDRGIHTVRNVLLDYVRQPTCKPGTVRWIVIDHMESFPELSQQALRRPMELHSHVACFIFIGTSKQHIIPPLLSRCKLIQLPDIQLEQISSNLLKKFNATCDKIPEQSIIWLITHSVGNIREFCQYIQLIVSYMDIYGSKLNNDQKHQLILEICSIPSFEIYMPFINSILTQDRVEIFKNMTRLWMVGESFEDVFETVKKMTDMIGFASFDEGNKIYKFLMKGWVQYSQGYTTYRSLLTTAL
jgi:DNA polymerase III delta prime subunit